MRLDGCRYSCRRIISAGEQRFWTSDVFLGLRQWLGASHSRISKPIIPRILPELNASIDRSSSQDRSRAGIAQRVSETETLTLEVRGLIGEGKTSKECCDSSESLTEHVRAVVLTHSLCPCGRWQRRRDNVGEPPTSVLGGRDGKSVRQCE
jgi:hypothetical protein